MSLSAESDDAYERTFYVFYNRLSDKVQVFVEHLVNILEAISDSKGRDVSGFDPERDMIPGRNVITEHYRLLQTSRYTFFVIDPSFMKRPWDQYLSESSLNALTDNGPGNEGNKRFILLTLDIDKDDVIRKFPVFNIKENVHFQGEYKRDNRKWTRLKRAIKEEIKFQDIEECENVQASIVKQPSDQAASSITSDPLNSHSEINQLSTSQSLSSQSVISEDEDTDESLGSEFHTSRHLPNPDNGKHPPTFMEASLNSDHLFTSRQLSVYPVEGTDSIDGGGRLVSRAEHTNQAMGDLRQEYTLVEGPGLLYQKDNEVPPSTEVQRTDKESMDTCSHGNISPRQPDVNNTPSLTTSDYGSEEDRTISGVNLRRPDPLEAAGGQTCRGAGLQTEGAEIVNMRPEALVPLDEKVRRKNLERDEEVIRCRRSEARRRGAGNNSRGVSTSALMSSVTTGTNQPARTRLTGHNPATIRVPSIQQAEDGMSGATRDGLTAQRPATTSLNPGTGQDLGERGGHTSQKELEGQQHRTVMAGGQQSQTNMSDLSEARQGDGNKNNQKVVTARSGPQISGIKQPAAKTGQVGIKVSSTGNCDQQTMNKNPEFVSSVGRSATAVAHSVTRPDHVTSGEAKEEEDVVDGGVEGSSTGSQDGSTESSRDQDGGKRQSDTEEVVVATQLEMVGDQVERGDGEMTAAGDGMVSEETLDLQRQRTDGVARMYREKTEGKQRVAVSNEGIMSDAPGANHVTTAGNSPLSEETSTLPRQSPVGVAEMNGEKMKEVRLMDQVENKEGVNDDSSQGLALKQETTSGFEVAAEAVATEAGDVEEDGEGGCHGEGCQGDGCQGDAPERKTREPVETSDEPEPTPTRVETPPGKIGTNPRDPTEHDEQQEGIKTHSVSYTGEIPLAVVGSQNTCTGNHQPPSRGNTVHCEKEERLPVDIDNQTQLSRSQIDTNEFVSRSGYKVLSGSTGDSEERGERVETVRQRTEGVSRLSVTSTQGQSPAHWNGQVKQLTEGATRLSSVVEQSQSVPGSHRPVTSTQGQPPAHWNGQVSGKVECLETDTQRKGGNKTSTGGSQSGGLLSRLWNSYLELNG